MHVIEARNVNDALPAGVSWLRTRGVRRKSRAGDVLVSPVPVTTAYARPMERVLHCPTRDANPFFHLVEAIWMLSGSNDLASLTPYVSRMAEFSDDGGLTQPGAYGYRWRRRFGKDQLDWAVGRLSKDPNDRRVVIQMYDCQDDQLAADLGGKDIPCNLLILPWTNAVTHTLDMSVVCRSNDIIWGAYGANAVHFSVLHEYLARRINFPVGTMYQISNNFHAYLDTLKPGATYYSRDPYADNEWKISPMEGIETATRADFRKAISGLMPNVEGFLTNTVVPMVKLHKSWKRTKKVDDIILHQIVADDWRMAAKHWLDRRLVALGECPER